jgi:hypothetical protein
MKYSKARENWQAYATFYLSASLINPLEKQSDAKHQNSGWQ